MWGIVKEKKISPQCGRKSKSRQDLLIPRPPGAGSQQFRAGGIRPVPGSLGTQAKGTSETHPSSFSM